MGNNMELGYEMFCYQCEQTAGGKGCTKLGVCGKTPEIAGLQDLLIFQIKGISCYAKTFIEQEQHVDKSIVTFIENALFTTLTNVNFDADAHVKLLRQSQEIKETLKSSVGEINNPTYHATYKLPNDKNEMLKDAYIAGIMYDSSLDPDIRSLRQTVVYGLKGISAYGHQARELGFYSDEVDDFYITALEAVTDDRLTVEDLIRLTMMIYALTVKEEIIRQLYHHIEELPTEQRRIILLRIEGYTWEEIAERLGISINTVKTQKARSYRFLREKMGDAMSFIILCLFL